MRNNFIILILVLIFCSLKAVYAADTDRCTLLPFENKSYLYKYDFLKETIPEMLISRFLSYENITLIERGQIEKILEERELNELGLTKYRAEIGGMGIKYFIGGFFTVTNSMVKITPTIYYYEANRTVVLEPRERKIEEICDLLDDIAVLIMNHLQKKQTAVTDFKAVFPCRDICHVAILNFRNNNVLDVKTRTLGEKISILLQREISDLGKVIFITREDIEKLCKELELSFSGLTSENALIVGKMLNADFLLLGSFTKIDQRIVLTVRLVAPQDGIVIFGVSYEEETVEALVKNVANTVKSYFKKATLLPFTTVAGYSQESLSTKRELQIYFEKAFQYWDERNLEDSIRWLKKVTYINPDNIEAEDLIAYFYGFLGNYGNSIELYKKLLSKYPDNIAVPEWLFRLGVAYYCSKDLKKALDCFERIKENFPQYDCIANSLYLSKQLSARDWELLRNNRNDAVPRFLFYMYPNKFKRWVDLYEFRIESSETKGYFNYGAILKGEDVLLQELGSGRFLVPTSFYYPTFQRGRSFSYFDAFPDIEEVKRVINVIKKELHYSE